MGEPNDPKGDVYLLGRGLSSSIRLTHQHFLWKDHFGWNLHPRIRECWAQEGEKERAIGDIACGNGIWLLDQVNTSSATTFIGLDISNQQFPPAASLAPNVSFTLYNVFEAPPKELHGRFSALNVRLILAAVIKGHSQVRVILQNLTAMLAPGGFLQWGEIDLNSLLHTPTAQSDGPEDTRRAADVKAAFFAQYQDLMAGYDARWTRDLASLFTESGLEDVLEVRPGDYRPEMQSFWWNNDMGAALEIAQHRGGDERLRTWSRIAKSKETGIMPGLEKLYVVGRKKME